MDGVNILANDLRTVIKKDVSFAPGAWVEFWDSLTLGEIKKAQELGATANKNIDDSLDLLLAQIKNWNFTDGENMLPITKETFQRFSTKLLNWFITAQGEVLTLEQEDKKKLPDNLSNSSEQNTQLA